MPIHAMTYILYYVSRSGPTLWPPGPQLTMSNWPPFGPTLWPPPQLRMWPAPFSLWCPPVLLWPNSVTPWPSAYDVRLTPLCLNTASSSAPIPRTHGIVQVCTIAGNFGEVFNEKFSKDCQIKNSPIWINACMPMALRIQIAKFKFCQYLYTES